MKVTRIRTFYQADPLGVVPGGIDTFIRGLYKWAPDDLEFSLVGMTTEPDKRPRGKWTRCSLGRRDFDFFPVFEERNPGGRSRVPLTVRLTYNSLLCHSEVMKGFDVVEFHRMEPLILFLKDSRPMNAFFHQDMSILRSPNADIRWRSLPGAYFWLEDRLIPHLSSGYCVREAGVKLLRERFPAQAAHINFVPTWVDTELFYPHEDETCLKSARAELRQSYGLGGQTKIIVTVGRLDTQKNPDLLFDAFVQLSRTRSDVALCYIGDGVLRQGLEKRVIDSGMGQSVRFLGLRSPKEIADILRAADVFALSSAYEGMPMALLEGLGSGLPVVTTDVGEVRKVVTERSGIVVNEHKADQLFAALDAVLNRITEYRGKPCVDAIQLYRPATVLEPIYENYRRIGKIQ